MDLTKLPAALQMAETLMQGARKNFDRDGHLQMVAFLIGTQFDPKTEQKLRAPGYTVLGIPPLGYPEEQDEIAGQIGSLARQTRAAGVAVLAEAWHADIPLEQQHLIVPGRVRELPNAKEVAYFVLEHRQLYGKCRTWFADIVREGERAHLGPFKVVGPDSPSYGRFGRLLGVS